MMRKNLVFSGRWSVISYWRIAFLLLFAAFCPLPAVQAQEEKPQDLVPPPLVLLSDTEKEQLSAQTEIKKRTRLSVEMMEARLKKAEELSAQKKFAESLAELGGFQAVIFNIFKFLNQKDSGRGKVLDNYKRLEINLRQFNPRLEVIRREMPNRYGYHVRQLMKYVRDARSNAVEPIFADTVLPEGN